MQFCVDPLKYTFCQCHRPPMVNVFRIKGEKKDLSTLRQHHFYCLCLIIPAQKSNHLHCYCFKSLVKLLYSIQAILDNA